MGTNNNVQTLVSFFNSTQANNNISNTVWTTAWAMKIAVFVIGMVGVFAMAIYVLRIAIDIFCLALPGGKMTSALSKFATDGSADYDSAKSYITHNIPNIILMLVLIMFLITGWIFNLVAISFQALGAVINKLLHLDVGTALSNEQAESFVENVPNQETSNLKDQYDQAISNAQQDYQQLNQEQNTSNNDQSKKQQMVQYTQYMAKAQVLANELNSRKAAQSLNLDSDYFNQQKATNEDGTSFCRQAYLQQDVLSKYKVSITCSN